MIRKYDPAKERKEAFRLMVPVLKDFTKTLYDPDLTNQQLWQMIDSEAQIKFRFNTINRKLMDRFYH
jgi:hypothetical protein